MIGEPERVRITIKLDIAYCGECPFHRIINNPDPQEGLGSQDQALLCGKLPNDQINLCSRRAVDRSPHRVICDRGRQLTKQPVPAWCPLRRPNNQDLTATQLQAILRSKKPLPLLEVAMMMLGLSWTRCTRSLELLPFNEEAKARLDQFLQVLIQGVSRFATKEDLRNWLITVHPLLQAAPLDVCKLRFSAVLDAMQKSPVAEAPGSSIRPVLDQSVGTKSSPASS